MGYSLWFQNTENNDKTASIDLAYGFNIYRNLFDPNGNKGKTGSEMVVMIDEALTAIQTKYSIRQSSRNLLNPTIGNLEQILRTLRCDAETHGDWVFQFE